MTLTRRTFDRALSALPLSQHENIWTLYIEYSQNMNIPYFTITLYNRYLMLDPSQRNNFISYLISNELYEEATKQLAIELNQKGFNKSNFEDWLLLCDICINHTIEASKVINPDTLIRAGISKFTDEVGRLWCKLANYYVNQGMFQKARDIYEEALDNVMSVRDFTIVFESFIKLEESLVTEMISNDSEESNESNNETNEETNNEIDYILNHLEYLTENRPILLNNVMLRQNSNNISYWMKRISIYQNNKNTNLQLITHINAIKTIDSMNCIGKLSTIWFSLIKFYYLLNDLTNCRIVLNKAILVKYKTIDELVSIYCLWIEIELLTNNPINALLILRNIINENYHKKSNQTNNSYNILKSVTLWNIYLDLEESFGTEITYRNAFNIIFSLNIITIKIIINYINYLNNLHYYEESFTIFERSLALFNFPESYSLWNLYINHFINRYNNTKLERLRDIFEQLLIQLNNNNNQNNISFIIEFYVKYAKMEEKYGLERNSIAIYDRLCNLTINHTLKYELYKLYILKVIQFYGITKTRIIYEKAITTLDDTNCRKICLDYSENELKLGEIDRARAIIIHGSQTADPRSNDNLYYWNYWKNFEEKYGNEETFRDMLKFQRAVEGYYSQVTNNLNE